MPDLPAESEIFAGLRVGHRVGEGSMGVVYLARRDDGEAVALKVLRPPRARDEAAVRDFENEAIATGSIDHEGVVTVFDHGRDRGLPYLVMEFVDGPPLDRLLEQRGGLPFAAAIRIGIQVARALGHAHGRGLVHRDVKPGNVLLYRDGRARLTDFGIVKDVGTLRGYLLNGRKVGTAAYASPEQCLGKRLGPATDMYSLGATLFHAICGRMPFTGDSPREIMARHVRSAPPSLAALVPGLPKPLSNLVEKMMAKKQADRPETMERLVADLALILEGKVAITNGKAPVSLDGVRIRRTRTSWRSAVRRGRS